MSEHQAADLPTDPYSIFVSYRRDDVPGDARELSEQLKEHFGADAVYFDVDEDPGTDWLARIRERGAHAGAFLAVIGPHWLSLLRARSAEARASGAVDFVRRELEWALRDWPGVVMPVLVGTSIPAKGDLPRSIRGVTRKQAPAPLRHGTFKADVNNLIERLDRVRVAASTWPSDEAARVDEKPQVVPTARPHSGALGIPAPAGDHYLEVIQEMASGMVVPWLGSCVRGSLPDSQFLAARLAGQFKELALEPTDLAAVAQNIVMRKGVSQLRTKLREVIDQYSDPVEVHRFLAALPGLLRRSGSDFYYQLIISTNYDQALERAFDELNEPFEYVVFSPSTSRFVHFPWGEDDAEPVAVTINDPSAYQDLPIGEDYELGRTVIVKLHAAPEFTEGKKRWTDDFVVTEDQYIDYLPTQTIEDYLPVQILDKLIHSRCLFLGYMLRDWSARVLLRRIWHDQQIKESSWAIENGPDKLEKHAWTSRGVELWDAHPSDYVRGLRSVLGDLAGATPAAGI